MKVMAYLTLFSVYSILLLLKDNRQMKCLDEGTDDEK
jgi:hypothetical protein